MKFSNSWDMIEMIKFIKILRYIHLHIYLNQKLYNLIQNKIVSNFDSFSRNLGEQISVIYAHTVVVLHHFSVTSISRSILSIQILNGLINKFFHDLHNFKFTKISFDILDFKFEFRFILIDLMCTGRFILPSWKYHLIYI